MIFGENAQGKTNLLEAIVYLSCGKSPRARTDREMIGFDAAEAVLESRALSRDREFRTRVELYRGRRRKMWVNQVPAQKQRRPEPGLPHRVLLPGRSVSHPGRGRRPAAVHGYGPLPAAAPVCRRSCGVPTGSMTTRPASLRDSEERSDLLELLPDFNERMVRFGAVLIHYRQQFAEALARYAARHHRECSGGKEQLEIAYQTVSSVTDPAADIEVLTEQLRAHMEAHQAAERASRMCLSGPHKDDLIITIDGRRPSPFPPRARPARPLWP